MIDREYSLEEMRQYCSEYIQKHFGVQYDGTLWWDKWRIIRTFRELKEKEEEYGQVRYFRQNEQKTKT